MSLDIHSLGAKFPGRIFIHFYCDLYKGFLLGWSLLPALCVLVKHVMMEDIRRDSGG